MNITTIILAAGKGTRMRSELPKVMHKIADRPLLKHAYDMSKQLPNNKVKIVYGHGGELVKESLKNLDANWIEQKQQLGTGHAVQQVADQIADADTVLILYGDVPLLKLATVNTLLANVDAHGQSIRS
jgi:bifunctional UDP-N-acetylglucosamine pyrophosphorylase/glucosamine-1-phosphate N-acetyltransferase